MSLPRLRVKMCGMTRSDDIKHAAWLGVDAIGLIFYSKSSRNVTIDEARELLKELPPLINVAAVVVNPDPFFVQQLIDELPIHLVQFHGDEPAVFCEQFNKPFIKAIHAKSENQINQAAQEYNNAQALLLDTPSTQMKGGTGQTFDWQIIPQNKTLPFILAGGLNESNVCGAVKVCAPYAVDVCSGVEVSPGVKDHQKMSRFMAKLLT